MENCAHCNSRNINHLENVTYECYDCGKTFDKEKELMNRLLTTYRSIKNVEWVSIAQCLKLKAIPLDLKVEYVEFMKAKYPTSNFNFVIRS